MVTTENFRDNRAIEVITTRLQAHVNVHDNPTGLQGQNIYTSIKDDFSELIPEELSTHFEEMRSEAQAALRNAAIRNHQPIPRLDREAFRVEYMKSLGLTQDGSGFLDNLVSAETARSTNFLDMPFYADIFPANRLADGIAEYRSLTSEPVSGSRRRLLYIIQEIARSKQ